ncbi:MAG: DinB family protein [Cytophagaceae bacterium]
MNEALTHFFRQYQLLTDWYLFSLADISDEDGKKVIAQQTNSLEWLAGHLITGRYRNMMRLGVKIEPYQYMDKYINQTLPPPNAVAFDTRIYYPSLTESRAQWTSYAEIFLNALKNADETILKSDLTFQIPTGGKTIEDALAFIIMHESYHIGQMSIIRKFLGYKSMQLVPKR